MRSATARSASARIASRSIGEVAGAGAAGGLGRCGRRRAGRGGHGGLLGRGGRRGGGRRRRRGSRGLRRRLGHDGALVSQGGFDRRRGEALLSLRADGSPRRLLRNRRGSPDRRIAVHRDRHDGDLEGLPIHRAVDGLAGRGVRPRLVAVHAIADAHCPQRAIGDALPDGLDVGGGAELQRRVAAATLEAGGGNAPEHVAGIAAAVRVQHRGLARAQRVHAHRVGRHLQLLGDQAEGGNEVASPRAGRPHHLDGACGAIDGGRGRQRALRHDRHGWGIRRGVAPARVDHLGHAGSVLRAALRARRSPAR